MEDCVKIKEHKVYRHTKGTVSELCVVVDIVGDGTVWVEWCDSYGLVSNVKEDDLEHL
jgi:hypothetical protein